MSRTLWRLLARDLGLGAALGGDGAMVLGFYLLAVVLFPLGVGPEPAMLARIAPGIIWVAALLAALLSVERLFAADWEDGSLELLALEPAPLELVVAIRALSHWILTGLPMTLLAPLLALLLGLPPAGQGPLLLGLLLGTPILSLLGAVGAALALGARRGGVLLSLLLLPLYVPVLVFGAGAVDGAVFGQGPGGALLLLAALLAAALPLAPLAAAAALRQALE